MGRQRQSIPRCYSRQKIMRKLCNVHCLLPTFIVVVDHRGASLENGTRQPTPTSVLIENGGTSKAHHLAGNDTRDGAKHGDQIWRSRLLHAQQANEQRRQRQTKRVGKQRDRRTDERNFATLETVHDVSENKFTSKACFTDQLPLIMRPNSRRSLRRLPWRFENERWRLPALPQNSRKRCTIDIWRVFTSDAGR